MSQNSDVMIRRQRVRNYLTTLAGGILAVVGYGLTRDYLSTTTIPALVPAMTRLNGDFLTGILILKGVVIGSIVVGAILLWGARGAKA